MRCGSRSVAHVLAFRTMDWTSRRLGIANISMLGEHIRLALRTRFSGKNVFNVFDTGLRLDQNLGVGITTTGIAALAPSCCCH